MGYVFWGSTADNDFWPIPYPYPTDGTDWWPKCWQNCPKCGCYVDWGDKFCRCCGAELEEKRFCPYCGKELDK